jgi:triacylglycerol lipase
VLEQLGSEHFRNAEATWTRHQFKGFTSLQRARDIDRQVKTTAALLRHQLARMGKTHGCVELETGLARLRNPQGTAGKLQQVTDPQLRLKQTRKTQVFTQAAPGQTIVDAAQTGISTGLAPKGVMLARVGVDRFVEAAMHRQVGLLVARQPQRLHGNLAGTRLFVDGGEHMAALNVDTPGAAGLQTQKLGHGGELRIEWLMLMQPLAYSTGQNSIIRTPPMLARLLRRIYFVQLLSGALLGLYVANRLRLADRTTLAAVLLGTLLLPLLLQLSVISVSMVQSRPKSAGLLWWRAFGAEFLAALRIFWFQLPWAAATTAVACPDTRHATQAWRVPVLLVHGYICNGRVWDKMARALQQAGHPVLAISLEPLFTSIDDYAPQIQQAVLQLQRATGATQVALVGHSMGGLAIRAWIRCHGSADVAKIITLGTPHQGTRMASWSPTPNAAQMAWHNPWLQDLQASETAATRQLMHIALTQHDNIVYPQREQVLPQASVTEFKGLGHLELCLDARVINYVLQKLH